MSDPNWCSECKAVHTDGEWGEPFPAPKGGWFFVFHPDMLADLRADLVEEK